MDIDVRHLRRMARGEAPLLRGELLDVPPRDEDAGVYMSAAQHIEAVVHSRERMSEGEPTPTGSSPCFDQRRRVLTRKSARVLPRKREFWLKLAGYL